jgi:hypothetical protein
MSKCASTVNFPSTVWKSRNVKKRSITAKATKTKLKKVRMFSRRICGIDFVLIVLDVVCSLHHEVRKKGGMVLQPKV